MKFRIDVKENGWTNGSGWSYSTDYNSWEEEWNSVYEMENYYRKKFDWDDYMGFSNWDEEQIRSDANPEKSDIYFELTATGIDENGDEVCNEYDEPIIHNLTGKWLSDIALTYCEMMGIDTDIE